MEFKNYNFTMSPEVITLVVTGWSLFADTYSLVDPGATGTARVWHASTLEYGIKYYETIPGGMSLHWCFFRVSDDAVQFDAFSEVPDAGASVTTGSGSTATTATASATGGEQTLFTVPEGKILIVGGVELNGGSSGGDLTFTVNDGSADVFSKKLTLAAGEPGDDSPLKLRHFVAGYSLKVKGSAAGMQVLVSAVEK